MNDQLHTRLLNAAAQELGVPVNDLSMDYKAATWCDGSLGLPKEGYFYTQAFEPGYVVTINSGDREIVYYASEGGTIVLAGQEVGD